MTIPNTHLLLMLSCVIAFLQAGSPLPIIASTVPLNPRSLRVMWSVDSTYKNLIANYTVFTRTDASNSYEETVDHSVMNYTFTGLIPYSYNVAQDGVGWSTSVVAVLTNGSELVSNTVERILPECHGQCDFRYYMGNPPTCSVCSCNPAFTGVVCSVETFFPTNIQVTEAAINGSYVLQVSWDPPLPQLLDGRLIQNYEVLIRDGDNTDVISMQYSLTSVIVASTSLVRDVNYFAVVKTISDTSDSACSLQVLFLTLSGYPGVVQSLEAVNQGRMVIEVSWLPPDPTASIHPVTSYIVEYINEDTGAVSNLTVNSSTTNVEIDELTPGTMYRIRVLAENQLGSGSAVVVFAQTGATICPMDTFGAPTDKECSPCPTNTGSLAQTTNITGCVCVQGYTGTDGGPCEACPIGTYKNIPGDAQCIECPTILTTSGTGSTTLAACDTCRFSSGQLSDSNPCYAFDTTTDFVPPSQENITSTSIQLSWNPQSVAFTVEGSFFGPVTKYRITCKAMRGVIPIGFTHDIEVTVGNVPTLYIISNLEPLVEYQFTVSLKALLAGSSTEQFGPPSPILSVVTQASPGGDVTLLPYITDVTPLDEDAVRVHYSVQPNIVDLFSSFTLRYVLPPPNTGTYAVVREPSSNQSDFTVEDIEPSFTYQFELVTEIGLFTYYSEVYSYNSTGINTTSTPAASPTPSPLLEPPDTVTAVALSNSSIEISWTKVEGAVGYKIAARSTQDDSFFEKSVVGSSVLSAEVSGLSAFTNYSIGVAGISDSGVMGREAEVIFVTTDAAAPSPPTDVRTTVEGSLINVTWNVPANPNGIITGYKVIVTLADGSEMSYTLEPQLSVVLPKPSGEYTVSVTAINHVGSSEPQVAQTMIIDVTDDGAGSSSTATIIGVAVSGFFTLILLVSCVLCLIACYLYRASKIAKTVLSKNNSYLFTGASEIPESGAPSEGILMDSLPSGQLTAKRWMRVHGNYSSSSALLPPMPANMYTTASDVVESNPGAGDMYAEVDEMKRLREGALPSVPEVAPGYKKVEKDATPEDYDNESLYQSIAEAVYCVDVDKVKSLAPFEIESSRITVQESTLLGEGEFGRVVKGVVKGVIPGKPESEVAIKKLKDGASESTRKDFLGEAHMLAQFKHPNVMDLLGVVTSTQPVLVIIRFMPHGSLRSYLKTQKKNMSREGAQVFGLVNQLEIGEQIASGMEYLASKFFIHRDLAARNVLVGENNQVKISDFGLSRALAKEDSYYTLSAAQKLPVKWMALESIEYRKFSTYGDIWSFGVVLWEIFSYGAQPYKGVSPTEVLTYLQKGNRLSCPEQCPVDVFEMMGQCWSEEKKKRPTFSRMKLRLKAIRIALRRKPSNVDGLTPSKAASFDESDIYVNDDMGPST